MIQRARYLLLFTDKMMEHIPVRFSDDNQAAGHCCVEHCFAAAAVVAVAWKTSLRRLANSMPLLLKAAASAYKTRHGKNLVFRILQSLEDSITNTEKINCTEK